MSVAFSSSTGELSLRAYTAIRSGTPLIASQASSPAPSRPPSCLGETRIVYAAWPATSPGIAPDRLTWLASSADVCLDLRDRRDALVRVPSRPCAFARVRWERALVDRVRGRVVDPERAVVDDDLRIAVAAVGLQLEPQPVVAGEPQPPGRPAQDRVGSLDVARVDQVVREADPRRDPGRRPARRAPRGPRSASGLRRRHGAGAGGRHRDRRAGGDRRRKAGDDRQQAAGRDGAQELHVAFMPF